MTSLKEALLAAGYQQSPEEQKEEIEEVKKKKGKSKKTVVRIGKAHDEEAKLVHDMLSHLMEVAYGVAEKEVRQK